MSVTVQLIVDREPVRADFYDVIMQMEIEESSDQPGTLLLRLPVNRTPLGDLEFVGDGTFEPMTNIAVTVTPGTAAARAQCIFDGFALSWRLHLDRAQASSTIDVWAQDASRLMNINDHVAEWSGLTDGEVADAIFSRYGFRPAAGNTDHDSPSHLPEGHTLFQRATDLQFLRGLARRGGKLCRVACTDAPGIRTGYFAVPSVSGRPAARICLADPDRWTVETLDFDWDVMRPTEAGASQVDLTHPGRTGTAVAASSSGLASLDARDYPAYLGTSSKLLLTAPADVPELAGRTTAVLTESGFFARCTGEADAERIGAILRVGDIVTVEDAGTLQSGNWLVWNVRHTFSLESWKMAFTLVRNAMGPPAPGAGLAGMARSVTSSAWAVGL